MIKIGIIGTDGGARGGHSLNVCKIINIENDFDARIVAVYGEDENETRELAKATGIDFVAVSHEEMLGMVDAVFVMFRDGNKHLEYSKAFIEKGIPVFIDKPFTITNEDAEEIYALAKKHNCYVCGGSSIKHSEAIKKVKNAVQSATKIFSGEVAYPLSYSEKYGGIHFYSHHVIEPMIEIFGTDVKTVNASLAGGRYMVVCGYEEFPVVMNYASHEGNTFAGAYLQGIDYVNEKFSLSGLEEKMCEKFIRDVKNKKLDFEDVEKLIASVKISNAMQKSLDDKTTVEI